MGSRRTAAPQAASENGAHFQWIDPRMAQAQAYPPVVPLLDLIHLSCLPHATSRSVRVNLKSMAEESSVSTIYGNYRCCNWG